ncbi:MAG: DUF4956 domain-containing protein [Clostridia bacterium]|nr:DUF4956 domain-containing protein [Clostridia bacterium]
MKSLINAFKDALAASGLLLDLTPEYIFVCISIALLCGLVIYAVYRIFYRGSCYSEYFNLLLLLTTLITTFIIMTISANIVLSLGMVGSLSIIRFRSAVKDPLDVGFLFWAVAVGITCGAGLYQIALLCTVFIAVIYVLSNLLRFGAKRYLLIVKYDASAKESVTAALNGVRHTLKNSIASQSGSELTVQLHGKKKTAALTEQLSAIAGVSSAMLVEYTGDN